MNATFLLLIIGVFAVIVVFRMSDPFCIGVMQRAMRSGDTYALFLSESRVQSESVRSRGSVDKGYTRQQPDI